MAEQNDPTSNGQKSIPWETVLGVVSTFGLTSILIVIVGRIWTIAYFKQFGLPAGGMEFTVNEFAFRSLEALIAIVVAALIASIALLQQKRLATWGWVAVVIESLAVVVTGVFALRLVDVLFTDSFIAKTSVLGIVGGLALGAALWLTLDVWAGPGKIPDPPANRPDISLHRLLLSVGLGEHVDTAMLVAWRVVAFGMLFVGIFFYLPHLAEELAAMEADADVATQKFSAAILESDIELPAAIATADDPMRSVPVRLILTRSENTHVLHSTDCTTVGAFQGPVALGKVLPREAAGVCKVFTIPTSHLTSIEFFHQSALQPIEIGLGDELVSVSFDSDGARDEASLKCLRPGQPIDPAQEARDTDFFNSLWYEITPVSDGAVWVHAETERDVPPSLGVWAAPAVDSVDLNLVQGSGNATGLACEVSFSVAHAGGGDEDETKNVVGVVANVGGGSRYLVSVGATEDKEGAGAVTFRFIPGARFLHPLHGNDKEPGPPHVSVAPVQPAPQEESSETTGGDLTVARVQLESWKLDSCYMLNRGRIDRASIFSLVQDTAVDVGTPTPPPAGRDDARPATAMFVPGPDPGRNDVECERDEPSDDATVTATATATPTATQTATPTATPTGTPPATATPTQTLTPAPQPPEGVALPAVYFARVTSGRWLLQAPTAFRGLVKLSPILSPDVSLRFAVADESPLNQNSCMQREIRVALEQEPIAREIGYDGVIIVELASEFECTDDDFSLQEALDSLDAQDKPLSVYVEVVGDFEVLSRVGDVVTRRFEEELGIEVATTQCGEICISVVFAADREP